MASNSQSFNQRTIRHERRVEINIHLNLIFKLRSLQTVTTFFNIRSRDFSRKMLLWVSFLPVGSYRSRKVWLWSCWTGPSPSRRRWRAERQWSRTGCRLSNQGGSMCLVRLPTPPNNDWNMEPTRTMDFQQLIPEQNGIWTPPTRQPGSPDTPRFIDHIHAAQPVLWSLLLLLTPHNLLVYTDDKPWTIASFLLWLR